ncbi:MAG: SGNH/GDSL hydrolase family protein [Luteolibacter sp.]
MKTLIVRACSAALLWTSLVSVSAAQNQPAPEPEILPLTVFENLKAGKKQTVVTYGTSLTHKGTWPKALADYLEEHYPEQVTFVNSARSGMTSQWGVENFKERVLAHKPDLVFIEFSINDADVNKDVPLDKSKANLDQMVKSLKSRNPNVNIVLQTMNLAWDSPRNEKRFGSNRPEILAYYDIYRNYARENKLTLIDNLLTWQKILNEEPERYHKMVPDGIHPSSVNSLAITWTAVKALLDKTRSAVESR